MIKAGNWDHRIPAAVLQIIDRLDELGYQTWLVGGCVRDLMLGRDPLDYDLATSARPQDVQAAFPHTFATGLAHGTVTVLLDQMAFEVTTFRSESLYSDGRHPDEVVFENEVLPDLARRDFTINSMAYRPDFGLLDPFGGWQDLQERRLRCVGEANERFREDGLRMLRAVRFALTYHLEPDPAVLSAASAQLGGLNYLSIERITVEVRKMMQAPHGERLCSFAGCGLLQHVADRLFGWMPDDQALCRLLAGWIRPSWHSVQSLPLFYLAVIRCSWPLRPWRELLMPDTLPNVERMFLQRCRISRDHAHRGVALLAAAGLRLLLPEPAPLSPNQYNRLLRVLALAYRLPAVELLACAADGWSLLTVILPGSAYLLPDLLAVRQQHQLAGAEDGTWQQPLTVRDLAISGKHPALAGRLKGPRLGLLLERLLSHVCLDPAANQEDRLIQLAGNWGFLGNDQRPVDIM